MPAEEKPAKTRGFVVEALSWQCVTAKGLLVTVLMGACLILFSPIIFGEAVSKWIERRHPELKNRVNASLERKIPVPSILTEAAQSCDIKFASYVAFWKRVTEEGDKKMGLDQ